ncbi:MAG: hypothetical protein QNJ61_06595 [Desulfobacterales bacterium]|nr:hypothetical protein [Desulfobacterales bacterium]
MKASPTTALSNPYYMTQDEYTIDPQYLDVKEIQLCDGVDMSDPNKPKRRSMVPLAGSYPPQASESPADYTISENFQLIQANSVEKEAKALSTYFKGAYNFASVEAAYQTARKEQQTSTSVYAVLDCKGYAHSAESPRWNPDHKPVIETHPMDTEDMRRQFLLDYGSHYVASITYGYKLAIRGRILSTDSAVITTIAGKFNAAFVTGSAEASATDTMKTETQNNKLELTFAATTGGLFRDKEERPAIVTDIDDIIATFKDLKEGHLKVRAAPVAALVRTLWNLLPQDCAKSRDLLKKTNDFAQPDAAFGVPAGTVIAWHPTQDFIKETPLEAPHGDPNNESQRAIVPPEGWAICDGSGGTPDLVDRFVRGVAACDAMGPHEEVPHKHTSTSAPNKTYRYSKAKNYQNADKAGGKDLRAIPAASHKHTISTAPAGPGLPAYYALVYIMKLE